MFDTLLSLPLFQGLGHADLTRILESTRLVFETVSEGARIVAQDAPCDGLLFVLKGQVLQHTLSADRTWNVQEELPSPAVVGMEVLYGSVRSHRHTLTALSEVRLLRMEKRTVAALTAYFEVFRLNVLNLLTTSTVRREQLLWLPAEHHLKGRIRLFMRAHLQRPAGRKVFGITMRQLGLYLGEDKRYISRALHEMQDSGLLLLDRSTIEVPDFARLMQAPL